MKTIFKTIIPLFFICTIIQCGSGPKKEIFTLVYLDFSLSQDSTTMDQMIDHMEGIFRSQSSENNSRFVVKLIEEREGEYALFDKSIEGLVENYTVEEEFIRYNQLEKGAQELRDTIHYYYQTIKPNAPVKLHSCICNTLENTDYVLPKDTSKYEMRLVIISDLLEDCDKRIKNLNKNINLCRIGSDPAALQRIIDDIEENYISGTNLRDLVEPENLYFILTGQLEYGTENRCLSTRDTKEFWYAFLEKFGYTEIDFKGPDGITFSNMLPDRLINKN